MAIGAGVNKANQVKNLNGQLKGGGGEGWRLSISIERNVLRRQRDTGGCAYTSNNASVMVRQC